ncbi:MAG: T9SS type A sorting domain-containing protein [Bacteroidetes bacterium]|nr:T9SS type A sorting domain-containing protein [Bacteroidota bacterium]
MAEVFDISGKLILTKTLTNLNTKLLLNTSPGLYLVKLKSEDYSFEKNGVFEFVTNIKNI